MLDEVVEQNIRTGERRLHTEDSLRRRLIALNVKVPEQGIPKLPLDTDLSWFRRLRDNETVPQAALPGGGWGVLTAEVMCPTCKGERTVVYRTHDSMEKGQCWRCDGKGTR